MYICRFVVGFFNQCLTFQFILSNPLLTEGAFSQMLCLCCSDSLRESLCQSNSQVNTRITGAEVFWASIRRLFLLLRWQDRWEISFGLIEISIFFFLLQNQLLNEQEKLIDPLTCKVVLKFGFIMYVHYYQVINVQLSGEKFLMYILKRLHTLWCFPQQCLRFQHRMSVLTGLSFKKWCKYFHFANLYNRKLRKITRKKCQVVVKYL